MAKYPEAAGHTKGVEASRAAAKDVEKSAYAQEIDAYRFLVLCGTRGAVLDEVFGYVKGRHPNLIKNNLSARLGRLCAKGEAVRSNERRTWEGGRPQSIYYTALCAPKGEGSTPTPRAASSAKKTAKNNTIGQEPCLAPSLPTVNRLLLAPVHEGLLTKGELLDIENWLHTKLAQPNAGMFSREREVAESVQKLLRIYRSFIA